MKDQNIETMKLISFSPRKQLVKKFKESYTNITNEGTKTVDINNKSTFNNYYQSNRSKVDSKIQTRKEFSLTNFFKRQLSKQKQLTILDIQKQIRQQNKNSPNIINMQYILSIYKNNYSKLQQLNNKLTMYQYERELGISKPNQHSQKIQQDEKLKKLSIGQTTIQPYQTITNFKQLEKQRLSRMKNSVKLEQKLKNNLNIQLSPLEKFSLTIDSNMNNHYLTIQKFKLSTKKASNQSNLFKNSGRFKIKKNISVNQHMNTIFIGKRQNIQQYISNQISADKGRNNFIDSRRQKKRLQKIKGFSLTKRNLFKKDHFVFGMSNRPLVQNKIQLYRDFLWKINMSNNLFIEPEVKLQKNYQIYIGKGNNSQLIKGIIKRRFWWTIIDQPSNDANFIWTQLKVNEFFEHQKSSKKQQLKSSIKKNSSQLNQKMTNCEITNNQGLININNKNKDKQQNKIKDYHENIFSENDLIIWQRYMLKNKKYQQQLNSQVYIRRAALLLNKNTIKLTELNMTKMHNHFISNFFLGNKKALFYLLKKYYDLNNLNVFHYLPSTFHISKGTDDPQYQKFLVQYNNIKKNDTKSLKNIWIVKPGQFTNRGIGITVCATLQDIKLRLRNREKNSNGKLRTFIVQKYLQRPLLYFKRKFDIRHYMMITCINGNFKGYWYQQGYIRTTSYEYNIKNCKDNSIHLTNDAIQKYTSQYGKYEEGNKLSYQQFQKYLDTYYKGSKFNFYESILPKMKKICIDAIRASFFLLDTNKKNHNFQLFGMDFMIDQQFNPWLIQINTNPCLQLSSSLLAKIIPNMIQNAFKISLDPIFQPPYNWPLNKKYQLGDNPLETNKFVLVFDEIVDGEQIKQLYRNVQTIDKNMGDIQEQDEEYNDEDKQWNQQNINQ